MARSFLIVCFCVVGLILMPSVAVAQTEVSDFATVARGACSPLPSCALPQRGMISCPAGGEPSMQLMPPWCPAEGRTKVRGRTLIYRIVQTTDERVSGNVTCVVNMNLNSQTLAGEIWGTYLIEVPGKGSWEGTWEGRSHEGLTMWTYKVVLFGNGEFEGLQLRADGLWKAGVGDMLNGKIKSPGQ